MRIRFHRLAAAVACLLALLLVALPARADPLFERVGIGAAFATPTLGISLFGQLDDRWSGTLLIAGVGGEVRANYTREESPDRYWTVGAGYAFNRGVVRAGYGRTWSVKGLLGSVM